MERLGKPLMRLSFKTRLARTQRGASSTHESARSDRSEFKNAAKLCQTFSHVCNFIFKNSRICFFLSNCCPKFTNFDFRNVGNFCGKDHNLMKFDHLENFDLLRELKFRKLVIKIGDFWTIIEKSENLKIQLQTCEHV